MQVGQPVHFYTDDVEKQSNGAGRGPYSAVVTQVFESCVNLKVNPPFAPPYDEGSVSHLIEAHRSGMPLNRYYTAPGEFGVDQFGFPRRG